MSRSEDLYDFPMSSDFAAFYREQEEGPRAVGSHGQEPPPPIIQFVKDPVSVKIFVPQERVKKEDKPKEWGWKE